MENRILKLMMLGDSGVGKSSILVRYTDDFFSEGHLLTTIGIDYKVKFLAIDGGAHNNDNQSIQRVKLQIWDTRSAES